MDKPKPNKLAQFYSGQIQPNGALSLRRSVQFWSGVDIITGHQGFCSNSIGLKRHSTAPQAVAKPIGFINA